MVEAPKKVKERAAVGRPTLKNLRNASQDATQTADRFI